MLKGTHLPRLLSESVARYCRVVGSLFTTSTPALERVRHLMQELDVYRLFYDSGFQVLIIS